MNGELRLSIKICKHTTTDSGASRWVVQFQAGAKPDLTVVVRMDAANDAVRDYYLLPALDIPCEELRLAEENGTPLDSYRFDTLDCLWGLIERVHVQEAA